MNPTILEYLRPDRDMFEKASEDVEAFDAAFTLTEVEESKKGDNAKKRVYWKDII